MATIYELATNSQINPTLAEGPLSSLYKNDYAYTSQLQYPRNLNSDKVFLLSEFENGYQKACFDIKKSIAEYEKLRHCENCYKIEI